MNRKWMVTAWVAVVMVSVLLAGCPKKKPQMVMEEPEPPQTEMAPPEEVAEPTAPPPVAEKPHPLDGDLVEAQRSAEEQGLLGDVYFDFDQFNLKAEARERLEKNAAFMKDNPQFVFTIEGHCDERGTNEYNLALGDRRASAASGFLGSLGIEGSRLQTISYGEERPFCTESNEECWWRNRRAHFVITGRR